MALSANSFLETCIPPTNFVSLAYDPSTPTGIDGSIVFKTYASNGLAIELQNTLTIPTQCTSGMDIVFLVDYTGSMGSSIEGVKTGITNILSTINVESSGNYRVGLCIFDEYSGNLTSPPNYGTTATYTSLPTSQKTVINTFNNKTQFITCMQPLGNIGSTTDFQTKLNLLNTSQFNLGNGEGLPEPGGLGVNEIVSNGISGSFRSDAIKLIILITDAVPGGNDDVNTSTDQTYFNTELIGICNSYDVQIMTQSSLSATSTGNYYYNLSTGTTPVGRYDQVTFDTTGNWINTGLISGIQTLCDSSYIATCESAPSGWYYESGVNYASYYDKPIGYITNLFYFPTATPTPIPPTATALPFSSYIAERNDGAAWGYVGPYSASYKLDDIIRVNDGSGICWTLGSPTTANYTYAITGACLPPTATPVPPTATPAPTTETGCAEFELSGGRGGWSFTFTRCDDTVSTTFNIPAGDSVTECIKLPYFAGGAVRTVTCSSNTTAVPNPTPTPTLAKVISPTPTPTPTVDDGGGFGGCLVQGTLVQLADGSYETIENLQVDQELASVGFGTMPDSDDFSILSTWSESNPILTNMLTNIVSITTYQVDFIININNGLLKSSNTHLHVIKRNGNWGIFEASELQLGDILFNYDLNTEIIITDLEIIQGSYTVYKLNVETNDLFIANGIVTHNYKEAI